MFSSEDCPKCYNRTFKDVKNKIGIKYDSGKPQLCNMLSGFYDSLVELSKVYNFGALKYGLLNWQLVEEQRYKEAALRHLLAICRGEDMNIEKDREDKEHTFYHASQLAFNSLALCYFAIKRNGVK